MLSSARQRNVNPRIFIQKNVRVTVKGTEPEHCIIFNILKRLIPLRIQPFLLRENNAECTKRTRRRI